MQPIQPLRKDDRGTLRFKPNEIVQYLLDNGPFDLNHLACQQFSQEDREQFAQLIGYSLSGFGELSYVRDDTLEAAELMVEGTREADARIAALELKIDRARAATKELATALFRIHPDDLTV